MYVCMYACMNVCMCVCDTCKCASLYIIVFVVSKCVIGHTSYVLMHACMYIRATYVAHMSVGMFA